MNGLVAPMALFKERIAVHVVSVAFPEAWLVGIHQLNAAQPLG